MCSFHRYLFIELNTCYLFGALVTKILELINEFSWKGLTNTMYALNYSALENNSLDGEFLPKSVKNYVRQFTLTLSLLVATFFIY